MLKKSLVVGVSAVALIWAADAPSASETAPKEAKEAALKDDTRVADAALNGDREAVRALIAQKVDVNAPQGDGSTALHWAAYKEDVEMTKMLLAAGANIKATTRLGDYTPLMLAAKAGSAQIVDLLLKAGADPNSMDDHLTTTLMLASSAGNADAVRSLLKAGADVNAREGSHGQTALMFAAALNRAAAIKVLLEYRADPNIETKAVKLPKPGRRFDDPMPEKEESAKAPAKPAGGAPKETEADQKASLDALAKSMGLKSAVYSSGKPAESQNEIKDLVTKLSAKVDALEKRLPAEKKEGAEDFGGGGRQGTLDMGGMTALLFAARGGQIDAAKALLQGGADINQVSGSEKTSALVMATMNSHFDFAKFLVDYGADPNLGNTLGLTPLFATIDLQWAPKGWFPAASPAQEKTTYLQLMTALLDAGANPDARLGKKLWFRSVGDHSWVDPSGATAFWRAAQSSDIDAMHLLIKYNANPDIPTFHGTTALMAAAGVGWGYHYSMNLPDAWMAAVKYCVALGADVNAADDRGYTALHGASFLANVEMIDYLIEKGGDVKAVAKNKDTVADMANGPQRFGIPHPEIVAKLVALGAVNSDNCRSDQCLVKPREDGGGKKAPAKDGDK